MTRARSILDRIVSEIDATGFGAHGLHVRVGDDTAAHRWTPDVREDVHSLAKGVCVIAAGIAVDDGLVSLDAPIATYLPDIPLGEGVAEITLRRLLTMSSGIDFPWTDTSLTDYTDLAREFLGRPSRGRVFQYSNASTYTAMRALAAVVGDVGAWLEPRLFQPLGIADVEWQRCPNGYIAAGGGLFLRTEELSRLGRLIRDRGAWDDHRIVSPERIDAMHADWFATGGSTPGYQRYALAGWDGPGDGWRLHGAHGQLVIFSHDGVVTITAHDHAGADRIAAFVMDAATA